MKTPTVTNVKAAIKRAATAEGFYLKLIHSKGNEHRTGDVRVREGFACEARDAGLIYWRDLGHTGTLADWLRSVLTVEELRTVSVQIEVDDSEIQVDYFSKSYERVLPNWEDYVDDGAIAHRWAEELLGTYSDGVTYDRGTHRFTCSEVASLCPSDAHALALALCVLEGRRGPCWTVDTVERLAALDATGLALFRAMITDWAGSFDDLLDAVEVLVPQNAPAPVELAPVELVVPAVLGEMPQAMSDYLGRLIHVPKKLYASRVYAALTAGEELPESDAVWADDVLKKVRRYARA